MYTSIFFRFIASMMTPAYNPQKKPIKVKIPYHKANVELLFIVSVKYHGIEMIVNPCATPEGIIANNNSSM